MAIRVLEGDCRDVLKTLPSESVHTVVTSPPYYGLRDYGTAQWAGGDAECDHQGPPFRTSMGVNAHTNGYADKKMQDKREVFKSVCGKCGGTRIDSQLGLEATPAEYIASMVAVFREVRRVLRRDGTCWVNIGDSYAANRAYQVVDNKHIDVGNDMPARVPPGLKPKDLIGIPWMLAFALRDDGWYLRSDIIWSKPNPMPESVTDRPTKAHEYVFLLTRSARYFYDADAIREAATEDNLRGPALHGDLISTNGNSGLSRRPITGYRNKRSVWEIATEAFPEAHFATYPTALVEPCIKAGCPPGGTVLDPFCGAGTTLLVADRLEREAIGIELSSAYATMARRRLVGDAPMFVELVESL